MGTITYLTRDNSVTAGASFTFSSKSLGDVSRDRYIIVGIGTRKGGTTGTISSVTVGGITATIITQVANTAGGNNVTEGVAIAHVPTGTTGDVVVTMSEAFLRMGIGMWRATGIASMTPVDFGTSVANDPTYAIDMTANGGFAIGHGYLTGAGTTAWTGLTEDFDVNFNANGSHSGAHIEFAGTQTNTTILCDFSTGTANAGVFAAWAYAPYIIDDSEVGFSKTAGWTSYIAGYLFTIWYAINGSGSVTATWNFGSGLVTGNYRVLVHYATHSNRATDAPYTIYHTGVVGLPPIAGAITSVSDNVDEAGGANANCTTVDVNQEKLATGVAGGVNENSDFVNIGTYTFTNGTQAKVILTDNANEYVIADAVKLIYLDPIFSPFPTHFIF